MDLDLVRGILTAVIFFAFIGIWVWAWSSRRRADFDAQAALPLEEHSQTIDSQQNNSRETI